MTEFEYQYTTPMVLDALNDIFGKDTLVIDTLNYDRQTLNTIKDNYKHIMSFDDYSKLAPFTNVINENYALISIIQKKRGITYDKIKPSRTEQRILNYLTKVGDYLLSFYEGEERHTAPASKYIIGIIHSNIGHPIGLAVETSRDKYTIVFSIGLFTEHRVYSELISVLLETLFHELAHVITHNLEAEHNSEFYKAEIEITRIFIESVINGSIIIPIDDVETGINNKKEVAKFIRRK